MRLNHSLLLISTFSAIILVLLSTSCKPKTSSGHKENEDNNTEVKERSNLYRILVDDKFGYMDKHGNLIDEPQYDDAHRYFSGDFAYVRKGDDKFIIDLNSDSVARVPDNVLNVYKFVDGYARIHSAKGDGIISSSGEIMVSPVYQSASVNRDGEDVYFVIEGEQNYKDWFITDHLGRQIGQKYDSILVGFQNGMAPVKLNGKWGYISTEGTTIIDAVYDLAHPFTNDGIARVNKERKDSYIDKSGNNILVSEILDNTNIDNDLYINIDIDRALTDFNYNRAAVILNGEKVLIDKTGQIICNLDFDNIYPFEEDALASVISNGKAAKIDTLGNVLLTTDFDYIYPFRNGVAIAKNNDKYGAIDRNGNIVIDFSHNQFHPIDEEELLMFSDKFQGRTCLTYYDYQGNLIWQDIPQKKIHGVHNNAKREDFVEFFDTNISSLDPIEGIYFVTTKPFKQDKNNPDDVVMTSSDFNFMAVVRNDSIDDQFNVYMMDGTGRRWANIFKRQEEQEEGNYAIINNSKNKVHKYSSDGQVSIEDFKSFGFRLEQEAKDPYHNQFVMYEFLRDYPTVAEYEQYQTPQWSGTGFAIADGVIATIYQLTKGAKTIQVKGIKGDKEKSYKAYVMASDKNHDLSIIKIVDKDFKGFGPIPYKVDKETADTGESIFVYGYPSSFNSADSSNTNNEIDTAQEAKLVEGTISSINNYKGNESMYEISANGLTSTLGAPLFNSQGDIIGIVNGGNASTDNTTGAVKASYLFDLINDTYYKTNVAGDNSLNSTESTTMDDKVAKVNPY